MLSQKKQYMIKTGGETPPLRCLNVTFVGVGDPTTRQAARSAYITHFATRKITKTSQKTNPPTNSQVGSFYILSLMRITTFATAKTNKNVAITDHNTIIVLALELYILISKITSSSVLISTTLFRP